MNCFIDLDGTLLDARRRLYALFVHLVPGCALSFEEYWQLKRRKTEHATLLRDLHGYDDDQLRQFQSDWRESIELEEWLRLDSPIPGVANALAALQQRSRLHVVTARQSEAGAVKQLESLGLLGYFSSVTATEGRCDKFELLCRHVDVSSKDWVVGDTGDDVLAGRKRGTKTAAVLSGFLARDLLIKYQPDLILEDIRQLPEHI